MAYIVFIDGVALPITPSKVQMKIKNQNKTINLINEGEINILKDAGLTELSFDALIPSSKYPFAVYPNGFKPASYFLTKFEKLKSRKKSFRCIISRTSDSGNLLFDSNLKVSLEDYKITEDAKDGHDLQLAVTLKQFRDFGTKTVKIETVKKTATVQPIRPAETAPDLKTYTVKSGDCLWNIAKKYLGNGSRYTEIIDLNKSKISNANLILPGQVLTMPN